MSTFDDAMSLAWENLPPDGPHEFTNAARHAAAWAAMTHRAGDPAVESLFVAVVVNALGRARVLLDALPGSRDPEAWLCAGEAVTDVDEALAALWVLARGRGWLR